MNNPLSRLLNDTAQRLRHHDLALRRFFPSRPDRPAADPLASKHLEQNALSRYGQVLYGVVVDAVPYCNWYKVQVEGLRPSLSCTAATGTGLAPMGVREHGMYPPGSRVWLIQHPDDAHGVILGADPYPNLDGQLSLSDDISLASRCGLQADTIHQTLFQEAALASVTDWSCHRPNDSTVAGEKGLLAETGVGWHVDPFMAFLRADENCGVWAFQHDQLLRVAGHNLQVQAAGHERDALDDEGEWNDTSGSTPYPWEALGALQPDAAVTRTLESETVQSQQPHYRELEPLHDDQQAFYRLQTHEGYLGQGWRQYLTLPPPGDILRYGDESLLPGVLDERRSLDGTYALRSARRVLLAKMPAIPVPKRRRRPEDQTGDTPDNYRAAGQYGSGDTHEITSGLRPGGGAPPHLVRAANLADEHAHLWNWHGDHPFYYHAEDFHLPEESDLAGQGTPPNFSALSGQQWLDEPPTFAQRVDHRFGQVDYYRSASFFDMLPDGGLVFGDGYGATITLTGGSIILAAPGDVWVQPGRNLQLWPGRDLFGRAGQNIELAAATKSVRIKADEDVQILAGNSGGGAMLLENRADGVVYENADNIGDDWRSSGSIMLKSRGELTTWSQQLYLRTGGGDLQDGDIVLDAGKGRSRIVCQAVSCERYLASFAADYFGSEGEINKLNYYSASLALIDTPLGINGVAGINGELVTAGSIFVTGGHIFTSDAESASGLVPTLQDQSADQANQFLSQLIDEPENEVRQIGQDDFQQVFTDGVYADGQAGDDQVIQHAYFSFRTTSQYQAGGLILFEARWQAAQRSGGGGAVWEEPAVVAAGQDTYPYPGREAWSEQEALRQVDPQLYDLATGTSRPRDPGTYGDPAHPEARRVPLAGNYIIIP